jgi:hypothetical protein
LEPRCHFQVEIFSIPSTLILVWVLQHLIILVARKR